MSSLSVFSPLLSINHQEPSLFWGGVGGGSQFFSHLPVNFQNYFLSAKAVNTKFSAAVNKIQNFNNKVSTVSHANNFKKVC